MIYNYYDGYLLDSINDEREARAIAEIDKLSVTDNDTKERLVVLLTYIIVCREEMTTSDDVFKTKLKIYQDEYAAVYKRYKETEVKDNSLSLYNMTLQRG